MLVTDWLEPVSPTDRHGRDALDFCNLSGCEQLVLCPTYIAGNRLDLVVILRHTYVLKLMLFCAFVCTDGSVTPVGVARGIWEPSHRHGHTALHYNVS